MDKTITYHFEKDGKEYSDTDLRKIVKKAEELIAQAPGESIQLHISVTETTRLIQLPVEDPSDKPFLTNDWITCFLIGCAYAQVDKNKVWCGKTINPNHPLEQTTTPLLCPVKIPNSEKKPNKTRKKCAND